MKRLLIVVACLGLVSGVVVFRHRIAVLASPVTQRFASKKSVEDRLREHGVAARTRLRPHFDAAKFAYPPVAVALVGIKNERALQLYAAGPDKQFRFVRQWPILAASGELGPKLREGDRQVPEGVYAVESLNPNSRFHLSLRVGYPNAFDREQAKKDQRVNLGGDIMIHGNSVSIGCLAMGDEAAEDLFVLAADTGLQNISVILTPVDFRTGGTVQDSTKLPAWSGELYAMIQKRLEPLPRP